MSLELSYFTVAFNFIFISHTETREWRNQIKNPPRETSKLLIIEENSITMILVSMDKDLTNGTGNLSIIFSKLLLFFLRLWKKVCDLCEQSEQGFRCQSKSHFCTYLIGIHVWTANKKFGLPQCRSYTLSYCKTTLQTLSCCWRHCHRKHWNQYRYFGKQKRTIIVIYRAAICCCVV